MLFDIGTLLIESETEPDEISTPRFVAT